MVDQKQIQTSVSLAAQILTQEKHTGLLYAVMDGAFTGVVRDNEGGLNVLIDNQVLLKDVKVEDYESKLRQMYSQFVNVPAYNKQSFD